MDFSRMSNLMLCLSVGAGDLLAVLDVSKDEKMLPTTYGRLQPPLGIHRLKVRAEVLAWMRKVGGDGGGIECSCVRGRIDWVLNRFVVLMLWACGQIVEFIAVLLRANSEGARHELVQSGAIQLVLKLFFEYVGQSFG